MSGKRETAEEICLLKKKIDHLCSRHVGAVRQLWFPGSEFEGEDLAPEEDSVGVNTFDDASTTSFDASFAPPADADASRLVVDVDVFVVQSAVSAADMVFGARIGSISNDAQHPAGIVLGALETVTVAEPSAAGDFVKLTIPDVPVAWVTDGVLILRVSRIGGDAADTSTGDSVLFGAALRYRAS